MIRVGLGYDSHRFVVGGPKDGGDPRTPMVLGGVTFPGVPRLKGHSDADVLCHAIIDALLGAAGVGDIGGHFPDTDPRWKGADSMKLLAAVVKELHDNGWQIVNVDATVICEKPKIGPRKTEIITNLSGLMGCPVSVKGKTNEKMDDIGAGLGVMVHAVALVEK